MYGVAKKKDKMVFLHLVWVAQKVVSHLHIVTVGL